MKRTSEEQIQIDRKVRDRYGSATKFKNGCERKSLTARRGDFRSRPQVFQIRREGERNLTEVTRNEERERRKTIDSLAGKWSKREKGLAVSCSGGARWLVYHADVAERGF